MRNLLLTTLCALLFISCQPGAEDGPGKENPLENYNARSFIYDTAAGKQESMPPPDQHEEEDTIVRIHFKEFELTINGIVAEDRLTGTQSDSVEFACMLGFVIEGKTICFAAPGFDSLEVEQYYQTSLTVQGEGPHCDLLGWKHHTSGKRAMKELSAGQFLFTGYTREEAQQFPAVAMAEVKQEIRRSCGEEWHRAAKNCRSVTDYPCDVGISCYFIRITGILKSTGKKISKIIAIGSPLGC